jgi:hypothetical protein
MPSDQQIRKTLFERLLALLGHRFDGGAAQELIMDLDELPEIWRGSKHHCAFRFDKSGFMLDCDDDIVRSVFLHCDSAAVRSGRVEQYKGNLPGGVAFGDHSSLVQMKLGLDPISRKYIQRADPDEPRDLWIEYQFDKAVGNFIFDGVKEQLGSIGLHLDDRHRRAAVRPQQKDEELCQNMTEAALAVLQRAEDECRMASCAVLGTEHLLLGMLGTEKTVAAQALSRLGMTLNAAREVANSITGNSSQTVPNKIPMSSRTKSLLSMSNEQASKRGRDRVNPEHILLAMAEDAEGVGPRVLWNLGVDVDAVRDEVLKILENES